MWSLRPIQIGMDRFQTWTLFQNVLYRNTHKHTCSHLKTNWHYVDTHTDSNTFCKTTQMDTLSHTVIQTHTFSHADTHTHARTHLCCLTQVIVLLSSFTWLKICASQSQVVFCNSHAYMHTFGHVNSLSSFAHTHTQYHACTHTFTLACTRTHLQLLWHAHARMHTHNNICVYTHIHS